MKALTCELPSTHNLPLSRLSVAQVVSDVVKQENNWSLCVLSRFLLCVSSVEIHFRVPISRRLFLALKGMN
jgi:serine acetyltransferase